MTDTMQQKGPCGRQLRTRASAGYDGSWREGVRPARRDHLAAPGAATVTEAFTGRASVTGRQRALARLRGMLEA